jgi:hypothetical protein
MRRSVWFVFLLAAAPLLLGMGSMQGPSKPEKIPTPVKKFTVTFADQMDVVTECTDASIEGSTFLDGKRGEGNYTVSFENIEQVVFHLNSDRLTGSLKLCDGGTMELILNKSQKAFGRTKYGTFQIKLSDLKKLMISPAQQR